MQAGDRSDGFYTIFIDFYRLLSIFGLFLYYFILLEILLITLHGACSSVFFFLVGGGGGVAGGDGCMYT